jgi:AcrR family transcriptional regulator
VARPQLHSTETILDAARGLVLDRGAGAATVAEIARASGAPAGSIYHRFPSLAELFTQVWIRAVRRSQAEFATAAADPDPLQAAVAAALSVYGFCDRHPADARLLLSFRREDLIDGPISEAARLELTELNEPIRGALTDLARRLYGRASQERLDLMALAVFDLPHGALRRPLIEGRKLSPRRRAALERAVRAALEQ